MAEVSRTIDLELKPARFKKFAEADIKTLTGKRNRVAIGQPRCIREDPSAAATLLTANDQAAYPAHDHRFYRISFDVTLYPDEGCRFRSADLVVTLQPDAKRKKLPLVLRLNPHRRGTKVAVKIKASETAKLKISPPVLKFLSAEVGDSSSSEVGYERVEATLSAFGAGTKEAGWKFESTESVGIPLCTPSLELLVVLPPDSPGQARFRLAAKIDVNSMVDSWLTELFIRDAPAEADYQFPEGVA